MLCRFGTRCQWHIRFVQRLVTSPLPGLFDFSTPPRVRVTTHRVDHHPSHMTGAYIHRQMSGPERLVSIQSKRRLIVFFVFEWSRVPLANGESPMKLGLGVEQRNNCFFLGIKLPRRYLHTIPKWPELTSRGLNLLHPRGANCWWLPAIAKCGL